MGRDLTAPDDDLRYAIEHHREGRFAEAVGRYRRALATPGVAVEQAALRYNLGTALQALGHLDEADTEYRAALAARPDFAEAQFNRALLALHRQHFADAAAAARATLALRPDLAAAYHLLGLALAELDETDGAFQAFCAASRAAPDVPQYWQAWAAEMAQHGVPSSVMPDAALYADLTALLARPETVAPFLARPLQQLVLRDPALAPDLRAGCDVAAAERLSAAPFLLRLLCMAAVEVPALEATLTRLRRVLLDAAVRGQDLVRALPFAAALARQCAINEYVFAQTPAEDAAVATLAAAPDRLAPGGLAAVAAYRPLAALPMGDALVARSWPADVQALIQTEIVEPREEVALRAAIPRLTPIGAGVSTAVRGMYEENPFPRWVKPVLYPPRPMADVLRDLLPAAALDDVVFAERPEILVAGCGTGRNALHTATQFAGARTVAIDLSLASLAYAVRQTRRLGFSQVEYAQADILEFGTLARRFDLIDSTGVLHHLEDPLRGWRVLTGLLRPGGFMRIGLYSELGRQSVVRGRALIAERGLQATPDDMRGLRQEILAADEAVDPLLAALRQADIYSMSELRDLLFHIQEHRYRLPDIATAMSELGLRFLGFELPEDDTRHFRRQFPASEAMVSLDLWDRFEQARPQTFRAMYQFWCYKPR